MDQSGKVDVWMPNENPKAGDNKCFLRYENLSDKDQAYIKLAVKDQGYIIKRTGKKHN